MGLNMVFPLLQKNHLWETKKFQAPAPVAAPGLGILVQKRQEGPCLCVWD